MNTLRKKELIQVCGKIKLLNQNLHKEIFINSKYFIIKERYCLREYYVKGKSYREIARFLGRNVSSVSRELRRNCTFFRDIPILSVYCAKEKQFKKQLPTPRDVLETRSIGLHRWETVADLVARADCEHVMRHETSVIQDDLPLDRWKISAFYSKKPAKERENAEKIRKRRKIYDRKEYP